MLCKPWSWVSFFSSRFIFSLLNERHCLPVFQLIWRDSSQYFSGAGSFAQHSPSPSAPCKAIQQWKLHHSSVSNTILIPATKQLQNRTEKQPQKRKFDLVCTKAAFFKTNSLIFCMLPAATLSELISCHSSIILYFTFFCLKMQSPVTFLLFPNNWVVFRNCKKKNKWIKHMNSAGKRALKNHSFLLNINWR